MPRAQPREGGRLNKQGPHRLGGSTAKVCQHHSGDTPMPGKGGLPGMGPDRTHRERDRGYPGKREGAVWEGLQEKEHHL